MKMLEAGIEPGPPDREGVDVAMRDARDVVHSGTTVHAA